MDHEHLSPMQKDDLHLNVLTIKMLEDLRNACGAEQLVVIASKGGTTDTRTYGMCGHEIIDASRELISFGLQTLQGEEDI